MASDSFDDDTSRFGATGRATRARRNALTLSSPVARGRATGANGGHPHGAGPLVCETVPLGEPRDLAG